MTATSVGDAQPTSGQAVPQFGQETRIGLVVYGGIALAIYMNGVCLEFYNAVRGRGIYKLIKALTNSDIVVDVISGTSAGGINGVLLSYALANSNHNQVVEFENFAQIWRQSGNIAKLLRKPDPGRVNDQVASLFDGEDYYQNQIVEALEQARQQRPPGKEWPSEVQELDLFVTGTDILGRVYRVFDNTGKVLEVKDHHSVFLLKHRQHRRFPFAPKKSHQSLAKLCRITSCFPVAFPVVTVKLETDDVDQKLVEWGQLEKRELPANYPPGKNYYPLYFVDGGVLDNRPFSYTLKEIYNRTAYRPVNRKLFYIDPGPDRFVDTEKFQKMAEPNIIQVIGDSLIGMPTYDSISSDLQMISEHNEKVRRYRYLLAAKLTDPEKYYLDNTEQTTANVDVLYWRSRLIRLRDRVLPTVLRMQETQKRDRVQKRQTQNSDPQKAALDQAAFLLTSYFSEQKLREDQEATLNKASCQIRNLDVEYALRKHFFISQRICALLTNTQDPQEYKKLTELAQKLTRQIKLLQVIEAALNDFLSSEKISDDFYALLKQELPLKELRASVYDYLLKIHLAFLIDQPTLQVKNSNHFFDNLIADAKDVQANSRSWLPSKLLSDIFENLKQKVELVTPSVSNVQLQEKTDQFKLNGNEDSLLRKVELASAALIEASEINTKNKSDIFGLFNGFSKLDQELYPFQYLSEIKEMELIETCRISPQDAQMGYGNGKKLDQKLAGHTLYAFGGFFKRSWRSNDILWGRLDGLNRIIEALLTSESLLNFKLFLRNQVGEDQEQWRGYIEQLVDDAFPTSSTDIKTKIVDSLVNLATSEDTLRGSALQKFQELLVKAGHDEIVAKDLDKPILDAIEEQLEWNEQKLNPNSQLPKYEPVGGYFDKTVTAVSAASLAKNAIGTYDAENKIKFFTDGSYRVSSENLDNDVPRSVIFSLASRAALVGRDIFVTLFGNKVLRNALYQFVDNSLRIIYIFTQLQGPRLIRGAGLLKLLLRWLIQLSILGIAVFAFWQSIKIILPLQPPYWPLVALVALVVAWLLSLYWSSPQPRTTKKVAKVSKERQEGTRIET